MNRMKPPKPTLLNPDGAWEESANALAERVTKQIEREFRCSKPKPRNRAMGFTGSDKSHPRYDLLS